MQDADEVHAVGGLELDVGQHQVGHQSLNCGESGLHVFSLAANAEGGLAVDGLHDALPDGWVVFDYEYFRLHGALRRLFVAWKIK